jgi:hypothetical protein
VKVTTNEGHEIADACLFKNAVQLGFKLSAKDLALYFQHKENSLFNKGLLYFFNLGYYYYFFFH